MPDPRYPPSLRLDPDWSAETVAVQAGRPVRDAGAPMNEPISVSSTYVHDATLEYARDGSATIGALEAALGALDGGTAVTFASGLAAATAIADLVPPGGTAVLSTVTYYGVRRIFERLEATGRLRVRMAPADDTGAVLAAADGADMVWVESIANPLMVVADVPAIASGARERGAITVVDATFATPLRQRPLHLGADIVLHSATKFLGGHSDLLLGAVVCRTDAHAEAATAFRHDHGSIPGTLEAFLALRGLRTLAVRLDRAEASAAELARRLAGHPAVSAVHYPGLPDDSQHERASRVLPLGCGPMLSFEVAGTVEQTEAFLARLRLFAHATSLGGVESLIERRARYAGDASVVGPTLCRVSVGLECVEDLWADLDPALRAAVTPFVPTGFEPPPGLMDPRFVLEPLGPEHNERDYAAWTSSMEHVRGTPGFVDSSWPHEMTPDENRGDLERHARDFAARTGFTYTVLEPAGRDVIGCVYIYPAKDGPGAEVSSWVRADHAVLDGPLAATVRAWLDTSWPFERVQYAGRPELSR